jgi:pimeloyl-ACP methyl ester carboxylesterase
MRMFGKFFELIHKTTKPRTERLPVFSDEALKRLTMPVLAIVGAKDALLDSGDTQRRIESLLRRGKVKYLDEVGHLILGQSPTIADFLNGGPEELRRA